MKRKQTQEHDEADARERAERHREELLAGLKAREAARRAPAEEPAPSAPADEQVAAPEGETETPDEEPAP